MDAETKVYRCPSCTSEGVIKASVAYEAGSFSTRGSTVGVIAGEGGISPVIGRTGGTSQSLLATRLAPPKTERNASGCLGVGALSFAILMVVALSDWSPWLLIVIPLIVWGFFMTTGETAKAEREDMAAYLAKWFCPRCGHIGDVSEFELK